MKEVGKISAGAVLLRTFFTAHNQQEAAEKKARNESNEEIVDVKGRSTIATIKLLVQIELWVALVPTMC